MPLQFLSPIHKASRQIGRYLEPRMRRLGLSNREAHLLSYLKAYGPCAVGLLHTVFGHPRSTLTSMLDRLEGGGLVTRTTREEDRRSFSVGLTRKGRHHADLVRAELLELEGRIQEGLGASDLEGFRNVMASIAGATSQHEETEQEA
jgi:DNA-binding MarR family transcriptional regulator